MWRIGPERWRDTASARGATQRYARHSHAGQPADLAAGHHRSARTSDHRPEAFPDPTAA
jgi:hypothetical protein